MSGALMSVALAVLLWPDPRTARQRRLAAVLGRRPAIRDARFRDVDLPLPVVAAVSASAVGAVASTPLVAGLGGGVAYLLARVWTAGRAERRTDEQVHGLVEGLAVVAAELRSGRPVTAATQTAMDACPDAESGRALVTAIRAPETEPGPHAPALRAALRRIAAGAVLSARTGCSLATVLSAVEDDLRAESGHRLELRSATAGPRAGALVLAGLPVLGLAMGSGVGADPWRVLTTTSAGQVLLVTGVAFEVAGVCWSRWLVGRAVR